MKYQSRPFCPLSTQIDFPCVRLVVSNAFVPTITTVHDRLVGRIGDNELCDILTAAADCWYLEGGSSLKSHHAAPQAMSSEAAHNYRRMINT